MSGSITTTYGAIACDAAAMTRVFDAMKMLQILAEKDTQVDDAFTSAFAPLADYLGDRVIPDDTRGALAPWGALFWDVNLSDFHLGIRFWAAPDKTGLQFADWNGRANIPALCNLGRQLIPEALPYALTWAQTPFVHAHGKHSGGGALITQDGVKMLDVIEMVARELDHQRVPPGTFHVAWHTTIEAGTCTQAAKMTYADLCDPQIEGKLFTVRDADGTEWTIDPTFPDDVFGN